MGNERGSGDREHCFCCGLEPKFNLHFMMSSFMEETGEGDSAENKATAAVFGDEKIAKLIFGNLASEDLLVIRRVSKDWNSKASHWLRNRTTQTKINSEDDARAFLQLLQNSSATAHPFSYLTVDLWEISLDTILELARVSENWIKGLTMSGISPAGQTSLELFIDKDISTKASVMLYAGSKLTFLSVRTDFQVHVSGILELILPRTFSHLQSLVMNILYTEKAHHGNLLEAIIRRRPALTSLGLLLPENGGENLLVQLPGILQGSKVQNISLSTPLSFQGILTLKNASVIKLTSLRIRVSNLWGLEFNKNFAAWLAHQSESLVMLGLTLDASCSPTECLSLPALNELEMMSLLVIGSPVTPLIPFRTGQFPKLSSFAFVQSSAELDLFTQGVFPAVTCVGFSGKNGTLPETLAENLPNLQHVTLCKVSPHHLETLLTKLTLILELVLIFDGEEVDYWEQFTGGAPRSWEELYEQVFPVDDEEDTDLEDEWQVMTHGSELDVEASTEFENLFDDFAEGFNETAASFRIPEVETPWKPSLANMRCLEYLKIDGWNEGAFMGLVHMSDDRRIGSLKHLEIQIPPTWEPPTGSLELLELYHRGVITTSVQDAMRIK